MLTIYPEETFDDEAECTPRWSGTDPGHGQKSFIYPAPAGLELRHAAPRPSGQQARVVDHLAGKAILGLQFPVHGAQERKKPADRVQVRLLTGRKHGWRLA